MELDSTVLDELDQKPEKLVTEVSAAEVSNEQAADGDAIKESHEQAVDDDPYAYLDRKGFTSEKFKIEIRGLPKFYGIGELKKLLNDKLKLGSTKVKPLGRGSYWVYACFRSEDDRQKALKALDGYTWKGKVLSAEIAKAAPDPLVKKRRQIAAERKTEEGKKLKLDPAAQEEILKASTTPLWNIPYEEQLQQKKENIRQLLVRLSHDMVAGNPALKPWIDAQRAKYGGMPCELWDIRASPVSDGYRNKCEFTIGMNEATGERTVGFRLGSYARGFTGVAPAGCLKHIPSQMKEAAKLLEKFVRESELDVFNPETHEGYWRQLTARLSSGTNQLMLVVGIHPQELSTEELDKVKRNVKNLFESTEEFKVDSLYFQHIMKKQSGKDLPPLEHLSGEKFIYETLMGLKFRVSPEAFFQINTPAAEVLYEAVAELAEPSQDTTLIDICCGTGSIGLCLAKLQKLFQVEHTQPTSFTINLELPWMHFEDITNDRGKMSLKRERDNSHLIVKLVECVLLFGITVIASLWWSHHL